MLKTEFEDHEGITTKIIKCMKDTDDAFEKKEMILFIPGNPGVCGFYVTFITILFNLLQEDIPVWIVGHAGHNVPDSGEKLKKMEDDRNYSLKGQVNHKIHFIREQIPRDVKIHLVGHSIGSYISMELLKTPDINDQIQHCYLLFPTIEYMAESPNGVKYIGWVQKYWNTIFVILFFLWLLPQFMIRLFVRIFYWFQSVRCDSELVASTMTVLHPNVFSKVATMANYEMAQVRAPDYKFIRKNKSRLTFLYSTEDKWTPISYFEGLVSAVRGVDATLMNYDHAFVLKSSQNVAQLVFEWIQNHRTSIEHP